MDSKVTFHRIVRALDAHVPPLENNLLSTSHCHIGGTYKSMEGFTLVKATMQVNDIKPVLEDHRKTVSMLNSHAMCSQLSDWVSFDGMLNVPKQYW